MHAVLPLPTGAGQVPPAGQHAGTSADAAGPAPAPAHPHPQPQHPQQAQLAGGLSWFVQLSDLHINKFVHHDILPDLLAFGDAVLSGVRPQALLITGDLVDAKTRAEGSQQHVEEWQVRQCCCVAGWQVGCSRAEGNGLLTFLLTSAA